MLTFCTWSVLMLCYDILSIWIFKVIQGKPSKVISYSSMTKLLEKGHKGVVAQLFSLDVQTSISFAPLDLQIVINNQSKVFGEIPKGLPPARDHDHATHFQLQIVPPNIRPYWYPCT